MDDGQGPAPFEVVRRVGENGIPRGTYSYTEGMRAVTGEVEIGIHFGGWKGFDGLHLLGDPRWAAVDAITKEPGKEERTGS